MRTFLTIVYITIVLVIAGMSLHEPDYNWDMLPYMGLVIGHDIPNADSVHAQTYMAAREFIPAAKYNVLIDSTNAYRWKMYRDPKAFQAELPLYSIKPLFILTILCISKLGVPLPVATVVPSLIGLAAIALLLLVWIRRLIPDPFAVAVSLAIVLSPFILQMARVSTPDLLTAALLLVGTYFILEKARPLPGLAFYLASVAVRIDAAIFVIVMLAYLYNFRLIPAKWLLAVVAAIAVAGLFLLLDHPGMVEQILSVRTAQERISGVPYHLSPATYLAGIRKGLGALPFSDLFAVAGIACIVVFIRIRTAAAFRSDRTMVMIALMAIHIVLRYILHPVVEDRFVIADYVIVAICTLMAIRDLMKDVSPGMPACGPGGRAGAASLQDAA